MFDKALNVFFDPLSDSVTELSTIVRSLYGTLFGNSAGFMEKQG
jgi:hypothetical protein